MPPPPSDKTKLTLRLDRAVIARAKAYAERRGASVSQLVEEYLRLVTPADTPHTLPDADWQEALGPRVRALLDRPAPTQPVTEEDYARYLEAKHLGAAHTPPGSR